MGIDELKTLDGLKPFYDEPPEARDAGIGLDDDLKFVRKAAKRKYIHALEISNAAKHLESLPGERESYHCVMRGNYHGFDLVPAVLKLAAPGRIKMLSIATLGFNKQNAHELIDLLDSGDIENCSFICSTYYRANEEDVFGWLFDELKKRDCPMVAMRSHAKILLFELTDGRCFTVESSANLRSCRNIEQFVLTNDRELLEFHRHWMELMLSREHK